MSRGWKLLFGFFLFAALAFFVYHTGRGQELDPGLEALYILSGSDLVLINTDWKKPIVWIGLDENSRAYLFQQLTRESSLDDWGKRLSDIGSSAMASASVIAFLDPTSLALKAGVASAGFVISLAGTLMEVFAHDLVPSYEPVQVFILDSLSAAGAVTLSSPYRQMLVVCIPLGLDDGPLPPGKNIEGYLLQYGSKPVYMLQGFLRVVRVGMHELVNVNVKSGKLDVSGHPARRLTAMVLIRRW